jgi:pyruvate/2-oxoglutarate dehydrogenase complex dihydrolipoamide acyltransferase (E2) component
MTTLKDLGIQVTVSAQVNPGEAEQGESTMSDDVSATPAAEELAASEGVDLSEVDGSGVDGRILVADVADAAEPADSAEAVDLNEDGEPAVAGELFGGADANQAVHETASEGISEDGIGDF